MKIIIIGGGASGFMAAITAAEHCPEAKITILEKSKTVLNKVRISGGGRCNVTHRPSPVSHFIKNYPRGDRFLKKTLHHFGPQDTIDWFQKRGVQLKTEADGRMFPVTDSSGTIIYCLSEEARKLGIEVRTNTRVTSVATRESPARFEINPASNDPLSADCVLIATGGHPAASSYEWIQQDIHTIELPLPSLFTFNTPKNHLLSLAGVSVPDVQIKITGTKLEWRGPIMITHWGFSGPAVLKLSAWGAKELARLDYNFQIRINWTGDLHEDQVRENLVKIKADTPRQLISSHSHFGLPSRLWKALIDSTEINPDLKWADCTSKAINKLASCIAGGIFDVKGKTTYKEEFVTAGGILLNEVNPETLESKLVPGLYFSGEVLDVDGITGGFNFQHAWTSGYIAGKSMALTKP